jgi:hypothetical protein
VVRRVVNIEMIFLLQWGMGVERSGEMRRRDKALMEDEVEAASSS